MARIWMALIGLVGSMICAAADMVIYADGNNAPKIFRTESGEAGGILADILAEVSARSGLSFEYRFGPWARVYREAIEEKKGAVIGLSYTSERAKVIDYSEPMFTDELVLFGRKADAFEYNGMDSLRGKTIAVKIGTSYGDDFEHAIQTGMFQVDRVTSRESQLRMLLYKRVDLVLIGPGAATGWILVDRSPDLASRREALVALERPFKADPNYLGIPKSLSQQPFIEKINPLFQAISEDGTLEEILRKNFQ